MNSVYETKDVYRDFKDQSPSAILMHEEFEIPAKSDVEYLKWLLKQSNFHIFKLLGL